MEATHFGYDAPHFVDLTSHVDTFITPEDKQRIDAYFDCKNESSTKATASTAEEKGNALMISIDDSIEMIEEFYTPGFCETLSETMNTACNLRPSLSMNNLCDIKEDDPSETTLVRTRSQNSCRVTNLWQPKAAADKFVSMNEAVNKFHHRTPQRYHSQPKSSGPAFKPSTSTSCTIPQSPALSTRDRQRPTHIMSTAERELIELEEVRKFKIKANPVNRRVLAPLKPMHPVHKSPTKQLPFNITQMPQRAPPVEEAVVAHTFHARRAPSPRKPSLPVVGKKVPTVAVTPNVLKHPKKQKEEAIVEHKPKEVGKLTATKPVPFSFDRRNEQMKVRKELLLAAQFELEKKMREFHARPLPRNLKHPPSVPVKMTRWAGSLESLKSAKSDEAIPQFKARAPVYRNMAPFMPKRSERPLTEIAPFDLSSERRAQERHEYEAAKQERQQRLAEQIRVREEEMRAEEERQLLQVRRELVHKAQPIREYPLLPEVPSKLPTVPETPNFMRRMRRTSDKENMAEQL